MSKILFLLCLLLLPCSVFAAGYGVYEWSARGNALGGAMVARDADPSAVAYNPACITDLPGDQIQLGGTLIAPMASMDVENSATNDMDMADSVWALPTAYYTRQLSDHYWFGIGMFSRVGLGTDYENQDTWIGRYNCSYAAIKSVSITPTLALRFNDQFSLAFGVDATYLDFGYNSVLPYNFKQEISADGWGYGINLGARYRPYDWLAFGLMWRSEIQLSVDGEVEFSKKGATPLSVLGFSETGVSGTEPVPESVTFGVMVKPFDKLSLECDAVWTNWSAYETLIIKYGDPLYGVRSQAQSEKNWHNTWRFEFGAEYALTDAIDLRVGYVYDQSPVNDDYEDYAVPCTDRQIVTLGAGWEINENWMVDVSYGYLWMTDRTYEARATEGIVALEREDAHAHMAGLSLTYKF